jgi:hypothetical protein
MPTKRPAMVVIIALMQLGFGGMALLDRAATLLGLPNLIVGSFNLGGSSGQGMSPLDMEAHYARTIPNYSLLQLALNLIGFLLGVLMVGSAVGLLRMRPWGRSCTILYALGSMLYNLGAALFTFVAVVPATLSFIDQMEKPSGPDADAIVAVTKVLFVGMHVLESLSIIYPTAVLMVMFRPSVRAAFRGEEYRPPEPDDYRDPTPAPVEQTKDNPIESAGP